MGIHRVGGIADQNGSICNPCRRAHPPGRHIGRLTPIAQPLKQPGKLRRDLASATSQAYRTGLELWDKELNRVYQELKKLLPEKSFAALKASQVQWLAFRDTQIAFINSCYDQYEGTMHQPMRASAIMEVTRARALDLTGRLDMHKEHAADAP